MVASPRQLKPQPASFQKQRELDRLQATPSVNFQLNSNQNEDRGRAGRRAAMQKRLLGQGMQREGNQELHIPNPAARMSSRQIPRDRDWPDDYGDSRGKTDQSTVEVADMEGGKGEREEE
ncbi:hypothetical protein SAY86_031833 [Trapa natans]|uniref:Uncharacterized protein n=1 Tax=Trapa natans TaxID=22666 RepID=A0AAN7R7W2_TRANT|nr:hypothetical protein SAY86_031833 [Trapa natans]